MGAPRWQAGSRVPDGVVAHAQQRLQVAFESDLSDRVPLVVEDRALDRDLQALLRVRDDAVWNP